MESTHPNEFESRARCRKALALADVLTANGATAQTARALPEEYRRITAIVAEVKPPSEQTWELVLTILEHRESTADAFDGLGA